MRIPAPAYVDFETEPIIPGNVPRPVGVSVAMPGKAAKYYAFGHATGNTATEVQAKAATTAAFACRDGVCCHNAKFDLAVAREAWGLTVAPLRVHDTMLLLFLRDPRSSLGLKGASERLLGLPPEERDAVVDWLIANYDKSLSRTPSSEKFAGAYVSKAPGSLVARYANGDVERTRKLFEKLYPEIVKRGMLGAYDRERELVSGLLEMESFTVPLAPGIRTDCDTYNQDIERIDGWLYERLDYTFNVDSNEQLLYALKSAKCIDADKLSKTATGKQSASKVSLTSAITDPTVAAMLVHRASVQTCLNTFLKPWALTRPWLLNRDGEGLRTNWRQVHALGGGAKTGRMSSSPNFQNIPTEFKPTWRSVNSPTLPELPIRIRPNPPRCRDYIIAHDGMTFIDRDYSQQELRIMAHYSGGEVLQAYHEDPWVDLHEYAQDKLAAQGFGFQRKQVKVLNFGLIYGMGISKLGDSIGTDYETARALKQAVLDIYPGLRSLYQEMRVRGANDKPIRTWGGREYYCEAPTIEAGAVRTYDYKLVNVLIQGSAADCTKQAMVNWFRARRKSWQLLFAVHDQLTVLCPEREKADAMQCLKESMEAVEFRLPMLTEGKAGRCWGGLAVYDKKGTKV